MQQPAPRPNGFPEVYQSFVARMAERYEAGRIKYGTALQPHNGRNALLDAIDEVQDLGLYLEQERMERADYLAEVKRLRELVVFLGGNPGQDTFGVDTDPS